jgi:hypothetical protein
MKYILSALTLAFCNIAYGLPLIATSQVTFRDSDKTCVFNVDKFQAPSGYIPISLSGTGLVRDFEDKNKIYQVSTGGSHDQDCALDANYGGAHQIYRKGSQIFAHAGYDSTYKNKPDLVQIATIQADGSISFNKGIVPAMGCSPKNQKPSMWEFFTGPKTPPIDTKNCEVEFTGLMKLTDPTTFAKNKAYMNPSVEMTIKGADFQKEYVTQKSTFRYSTTQSENNQSSQAYKAQ